MNFKFRICRCGSSINYRWRQFLTFPIWRCSKKKCRKEIGFLKDTFFEETHISLKEVKILGFLKNLVILKIFRLSYYWCRQTHTVEEILFDMQRENNSNLSSSTITDWKNFFRNICAFYFERHPTMIGGPGTIVEIDETVIIKRKYNR